MLSQHCGVVLLLLRLLLYILFLFHLLFLYCTAVCALVIANSKLLVSR